jgi:ABC-2 type transport system permease protein
MWELLKRAFQRQLAYRASALAGLATNLFFGLLRAAVLVALFGARREVDGITVQAAVTYTGLAQATIGFFSLFGWYELMRSVYSGEVGADLLKPMGYSNFWLAQEAGRSLANLVLRGLPLMAAYALLFQITIPHGLGQWLALLLALVLAWLVGFSYRFLVNLASFWSPEAVGFGRLAFALSWFLSGFLMPLRFFPDWFQSLCYLTPFPHMVNTVVEVYLGLLSPLETLAALAGQVFWAGLLLIAGQLVLHLGIRRLVILGG